MSFSDLANELREQRIVHHGMLKSGGVAELNVALGEWRQRSLHAFILVVPQDRPLSDYDRVATAMKLRPKTELLLLFNGKTWRAKGWGLSTDRLQRILDESRSFLRPYWAKGLAEVIHRAGEAASGIQRSGAPPRPEKDDGFPWVALGLGGALALGVGWVIQRRLQEAEQSSGELRAALDIANERFASVMLESDSLPHELGVEIQTQASRIHEQLKRLEQEGSSGKGHRHQLAQIEQLRNELVQLDSRVMAERHKGRSA